MDFAKFSVADLIESIATAAGVVTAIIYIAQNRSMLKELRRQNDLASEPILRWKLVSVEPTPEDTASREAEAKGEGELELVDHWSDLLTKANVEWAQRKGKRFVYVSLSNKGRTSIEEVCLRFLVTVEHHDAVSEAYAPVQRGIAIRCIRDIDPQEPEVLVRLCDISAFPKSTFRLIGGDYTDVRKLSKTIEAKHASAVSFTNDRLLPATEGKELEGSFNIAEPTDEPVVS